MSKRKHPKGWAVARCPDAHCAYKVPYLIASKCWQDLANIALKHHMDAKGHEHPQTRFGGLGDLFGGIA